VAPGPDHDLFNAFRDKLGNDLPIIAEDLGVITEGVNALRDDLRPAGMRILQFAFNAAESGKGPVRGQSLPSAQLQHQHAGLHRTHDNDTLRGWLDDKASASSAASSIPTGLQAQGQGPRPIQEAMKSKADIAVFPMQDILNLGNQARMNIPSTLGGNNWAWRMAKNGFSKRTPSGSGAYPPCTTGTR
jgi:4-alpha-glucanotransferase